jgi:hypothetical protein
MHGLDRLLSKPSQLYVLRVLHHAEEPLTGREIERRTGLSNRATMMALESLVDIAAVDCEPTAQANWYALNRDHYLVAKAMKSAFEAEDLFWEDLRKTVRRVVVPRPSAAVVTGPLAREDSMSEGRLEMTLLFSTSRNRIRAFRTIETLEEAVWSRYALDLTTNLLAETEVNDDEHEQLWRRVEREGILLFGTLP